MQPMGDVAGIQLGPAGQARSTVDETPALYLPIWALTAAHAGRKIRTEGQVLAFDPSTSQLLVASARDPSHATGHTATLLITTRVALSGQSPAATNVAPARDGVALKDLQARSWDRRYEAPRLSFEKGAWVIAVGWLEGEVPSRVNKMVHGTPYNAPFLVTLNAIHLSGRSPPPVDALHQTT